MNYARVSVDEQAQKPSIPAQVGLLHSFGKTNNYNIFKEYVDKGDSSTVSERPQLQELLSDVGKRMVKVVLVYRIDRFFRNARKFYSTPQMSSRKLRSCTAKRIRSLKE